MSICLSWWELWQQAVRYSTGDVAESLHVETTVRKKRKADRVNLSGETSKPTPYIIPLLTKPHVIQFSTREQSLKHALHIGAILIQNFTDNFIGK